MVRWLKHQKKSLAVMARTKEVTVRTLADDLKAIAANTMLDNAMTGRSLLDRQVLNSLLKASKELERLHSIKLH